MSAKLHGTPPYSVAIWDRHELTRLALYELLSSSPLFRVRSLQNNLSATLAQIKQESDPLILLFDIAQLLDSHSLLQLIADCTSSVHLAANGSPGQSVAGRNLTDEALATAQLGSAEQFAAEDATCDAVGAAASKLMLVSYASFAYDHHIEAALALGARAYVLKSSPLTTLVTGLSSVATGHTFFDASVSSRLIAKDNTMPPHRDHGLATRRSLLSKREKEVLSLVAEGFKAKEIAKTLHISAKTVDRHKANLMTKLAIHSQIGLTRYALAETPGKTMKLLI